MVAYIVRRLFSATPTLFGVTVAVFMFVHLLPGDPARLMAGIQATEESVQLVRHALGLDKPLWVQYGIYLSNLLHGSLGLSNRDSVPVSTHIAQAFWPTLGLTIAAMLVAIAIGLTAGIVAAVSHGHPLDYSTTSLAMLGISLPSFVLALALIWIFGVELQWLPTGGTRVWRPWCCRLSRSAPGPPQRSRASLDPRCWRSSRRTTSVRPARRATVFGRWCCGTRCRTRSSPS